jgi:hypothetical protein
MPNALALGATSCGICRIPPAPEPCRASGEWEPPRAFPSAPRACARSKTESCAPATAAAPWRDRKLRRCNSPAPGDDDSRRCGRCDVDVVHADSEARNDFALLHFADHVRRDFRVGDQQARRLPGHLHDGLRRGLRAMRNSAPTRERTARARSRFGNTESETATSGAMATASWPLPCAPSA